VTTVVILRSLPRYCPICTRVRCPHCTNTADLHDIIGITTGDPE
jgi:hypothetical protein